MHTQRRQQVIVSRRHDSSLASLAATTMRRLLLPFLLLPLCTMTVGCHSYLTPVGSEPIAALPVETVGGDLLEVDGEGKLWVRPGRDRIGAALGVQLAENAQGVVVSASSPSKADGKIIDTHDWVSQDLPFPHLAAGDRIVTVAAVVPPSGWRPTRSSLKRLRKRGLDNTERKIIDTHDWVSQDLPFEALHPRTTWQQVRSAPQAHDIDTLDDLQGYTSAYGWLTLDLAVERNGREVVVRLPLTAGKRQVASSPLETKAWRTGFRMHQITDPDIRVRPRHASAATSANAASSEADWVAQNRSSFLVTYVATNSLAAVQGLRPFDAIVADSADQVTDPNQILTRIRRNGHKRAFTPLPKPDPTDIWIPFLFSYQADGRRSHIGIGPFEALFHYSSKHTFDPATDSVDKTWRWSALTTIFGNGEKGKSGRIREAGVAIFDPARLLYFSDWVDSRDK